MWLPQKKYKHHIIQPNDESRRADQHLIELLLIVRDDYSPTVLVRKIEGQNEGAEG